MVKSYFFNAVLKLLSEEFIVYVHKAESDEHRLDCRKRNYDNLEVRLSSFCR